MIKVLKAGTKKKINCPDCGAYLSYDENEDVKIDTVRTIPTNCVEGYARQDKYIICPQCGFRIMVTPHIK